MNKYLTAVAAILLSSRILPAHAALKVLATTPEWAALTQELGGDKVDVYAATSAFQDVHRVDAKPSLVARARNADLVVAAGAELRDYPVKPVPFTIFPASVVFVVFGVTLGFA